MRLSRSRAGALQEYSSVRPRKKEPAAAKPEPKPAATDARGAQPSEHHQLRLEQVVKALRDNPVRRITQDFSLPDSR